MKTVKRKTFFQKMAEIFFAIYIITLYLLVDKEETIIYSEIVFVLFCGFTAVFLLQRQRIHLGRNVMAVYVAFTWIFASVFWAVNSYVAWRMVKTMWQLFAMFFMSYNLFCEDENSHRYFIKTLYIAGIALIGYSIYTYGLGEVVEMMSNSNFRFGKEINHENTFGMLNATTVIVAFYYIFYKHKHKLFHLAVMAGGFLFAMSSGSRKALLMICIAALYLIYKKYGTKKFYKTIAITLVMAVLFVLIIQLPAFETIRSRMDGLIATLNGEGKIEGSANERLNMIKDGWVLYKERLIAGFGINNFQIVSRFGTYAHNNFIEILVDLGIIGFVLYYLIYWNTFKNLVRMKNDEGKAMLCIFIVRLIMEIALVTYYDKLTWIMLAFFLMNNEKTKNELPAEGETYEENIMQIEKSN